MNTMTTIIDICIFEHATGLTLPAYATDGAAGMDLRAAIEDNIVLVPMERVLVPAGFAMALPMGYEAQIRPRSGLAHHYGVSVLNAPGTIDSDYRGEVKILLINMGTENFIITRGQRIAQMVIAPMTQAQFNLCPELRVAERDTKSFGSTGTN